MPERHDVKRDDRQHKGRRRDSRKRRHSNRKTSHRISEHFSKKDFVCQSTGKLRISLGLVGALELLRAKAGQRVNIMKGYFSPDAEDGPQKRFKRDYHTLGLAADVTVNEMDIMEVFKLAEGIEDIKGLGLSLTEHHVHIDTRKADERVCWVEDRGDIISLTDENRDRYIS